MFYNDFLIYSFFFPVGSNVDIDHNDDEYSDTDNNISSVSEPMPIKCEYDFTLENCPSIFKYDPITAESDQESDVTLPMVCDIDEQIAEFINSEEKKGKCRRVCKIWCDSYVLNT